MSRLPTLETVGGIHYPKPDERHDPEANVLFLVHVECDACGYVLLFNSERLEPGSARNLIRGYTVEEEAAAEAAGEFDDE